MRDRDKKEGWEEVRPAGKTKERERKIKKEKKKKVREKDRRAGRK